jgi:cobalt/nickel transport system permease protein
MHMADALPSPAVGATFWAGTVAVIGYASRKLKAEIDDRMIPLMGVLGAFIFASQMVNFTIPGTGSSGHLGGGMTLAILLGPPAAFLVMASVLTVQALFFADGGLLALGCNIWNLGLYPCFIAFPLVYRPLAGDGSSARRVLIASLAGAVTGLQLGALSVVVQTLLSGKSELPFGTFALVMQPIHLAIGVVEGFVTAGVITYVRSARPELLETTAGPRSAAGSGSLRKVLVSFAVLALVAGGVFSWFASTRPDGLEWSLEKVFGGPAAPRHQGQEGAPALQKVQEKTAFLPDYGFRGTEGESRNDAAQPAWPKVDAGTSASGLIGAGMVFVLVVLVGASVRFLRRRRHP